MERGSRCTRSQAAPDWTVSECLTLINEISVIEGEWRQALASFQKWQLVVENCNALEVNRSLNQCKKKWDELRALYRKVKPWKANYWSYNINKKRELGLPEEFDCELFKAIDMYFKKKGTEDNNAAEPESDPDTDHDHHRPDTNKFFLQTGPKKRRRKMVTRKRTIFESFQPWRTSVNTNVNQEPSSLNEMPEVPRDKDDDIACKVVEHEPSTEGGGREKMMMAAELLKNAELINAIIQGNLTEDVNDMKVTEADQPEFTRLQGDKLIDCLGKIANTLNHLCDLVYECN